MHSALKKTLGVISVAVLLAAAGFFTLDRLLASDAGASVRVATLLHIRVDALGVADQKPSEAVDVRMAALKAPGFVAIYDDEEGPGKLLGASALLPVGVSREARVPLQQPLAAGWYYAMIRKDDGDGAFDPEKDLPARDARGVIVMTRFLISPGE